MLNVILGLLAGALASAIPLFMALRQQARAAADAQARAQGAEAALSELRRSSADALAQSQQRERSLLDETHALRAELAILQQSNASASARLDESKHALESQRALVAQMEERLREGFRSLAHESLAANSGEFLKLAQQALKAQSEQGAGELNSKKALIDQSLESMATRLGDMQRKFEELGAQSAERMGHVAQEVQRHAEGTARLTETTERLQRTLSTARARGQWGERMAEDILRIVGMHEGVNYLKQKTLENSAGRPDFTFLLPRGLTVNMDVKFPMDNYLHYLGAENDHDRKRFRDELIKNTRSVIRQVTTREYINPEAHTVDYVLVFIPNEQVYGFINESDPTLMDEALKLKVVLCSPFTLYAVLAVMRQAVENFNLEQTASEMLRLMGEFSKQWGMYKERFKGMGDKLELARKEYEALVTTRSNQLERPLRKIEELRRSRAIAIEGELNLDGDTTA